MDTIDAFLGNEMQKMGYNENDFNALIEKVNDTVSCGESCQRRRNTHKLRLDYEKALDNYKSLPTDILEKEKAYYISSKGIDYYDRLMHRRYEKEARMLKVNNENEHRKLVSDMRSKNQIYRNITEYNSRLIELKKRIEDDNTLLKTKLDEYSTTVNINNRKTYYGNQQNDYIGKWNKYAYTLFFLVFIIFIIKLIIVEKKYMDKMVWFKIIIVLLIPFAILPAIKFVLIYLYNSIFKPGKSADEWKLIQMIKEKNKPIH
jgi:hypothetical protein